MRPMTKKPIQPMNQAFHRSKLDALEQLRHLVTPLSHPDAGLMLNPEARRFGNDYFISREPDGLADLLGLDVVCSLPEQASVHDHDTSKQRGVNRDERTRPAGESLELFEGDRRELDHRPHSKPASINKFRPKPKPLFQFKRPKT